MQTTLPHFHPRPPDTFQLRFTFFAAARPPSTPCNPKLSVEWNQRRRSRPVTRGGLPYLGLLVPAFATAS